MKITIVQGPFLPVPALRGGAVEKMWFALGPEFVARGHSVTHLSRWCDGLPEREAIRGVQHVRVPGYDRPGKMPALLLLDFLFARRIARIAPEADVAVTNSFWAPVLLKRRQGAIYVDVQRMPKGQMKLYDRAARLRANSSAVRDAIVAERPSAAPRVRVVPNPLPFVPEQPVDWRRKEKVVLFAGRLHPEKGLELLLRAWRHLRAQRKLDGWTLELIGPAKVSEGGGGEAWLAPLQQGAAADGVVWRPPIYDTTELSRAYERATVFAYPSLAEKGETFGLAVLEAMAWGGLPVVSDLACFRDFLETGRNGFIFDHRSADPVAALAGALERAADPAARSVAERAVTVRESHSSAAIAEQFLADFESLR